MRGFCVIAISFQRARSSAVMMMDTVLNDLLSGYVDVLSSVDQVPVTVATAV